jgi:glycosyltransferase involved in cell wall biosynthesis
MNAPKERIAMRILYFLNGSNFTGAGGMEYHLVDITAWMEGRGITTAAAVRKGTYLQEHLLREHRNVFPLHWTGIAKVFSLFEAGLAILRFKPDIISINRERDIKRVYYISRILGPILKKRPKLVAIFQNVGIGFGRSFDLGRLDGLICTNNFTKQEFVSGNPAAERKSRIIYYGIPLPEVDPLRKTDPGRERRFFKNAGFPLIGMVGNFRKNQTELVDAAYHMRQRCGEFTIAFIGNGTEDQIGPLKEKISRLGLEKHFLFTGAVEHERMPDVFYDLDISVSTNRREAFGIVFIESLASYTPLVTYDSGGPVEILDKGGGVLVHGGAPEMADTLCELIRDHKKRETLGCEGRAVAEKYFSIDAMGEQHLELYRELLDGGDS